jgi:predicted ATPase
MAQKAATISAIAVCGFKSIYDEQQIEIRPLTILAGANSSGKSSLMQPILLLKQTLEAVGDPGALLLDGPNVRLTKAEQLLSRGRSEKCSTGFSIRISKLDGESLETHYVSRPGRGFDVDKMKHIGIKTELSIDLSMDHDKIVSVLPEEIVNFFSSEFKNADTRRWRVVRDFCFLAFTLSDPSESDQTPSLWRQPIVSPTAQLISSIKSIIHLPGLRGNPRRTYPKTATGSGYRGTFDDYVASLIFQWQTDDKEKLNQLSHYLELLGLSWKVSAKAVSDAHVELLVGRLPHGRVGGAHDTVSIADVGFGVSQSLPVLVSLVAAEPGQLVYLEQPEIHLHPRAQRRLAQVLCDAANRGVYLVVETHCALLLREIQLLVAHGKMPMNDVKLHWFQRNEEGATIVSSSDMDELGAWDSQWPEDFDYTELEVEQAYLDAVELKRVAE